MIIFISESNIKVIEKKGNKLGKTVVILAGVHGNEFCGVKAFDKIIPKIKIESGKVIFIYANLKAINENKRYIENNLNRCFLKNQPIEINETIEGKTAKEIMPYLDKADLMLDLHASFTEGSQPFVICDEKWLSSSSIFDAEIASYNWDEFEPGSTDYYMNLQNKPGFCFECGYLKDKNTIMRAEKAIYNFLMFSGNFSGDLSIKDNQKIIRIKGIYKSKSTEFNIIREYKDFQKFDERICIGIDGNEKVFVDKGDIILFLTNAKKKNEECFLVAEETLLNPIDLVTLKSGEKNDN